MGYNSKFNGSEVDELLQKVKDMVANPILESVYPVGAIYISTVSTNPSTLFGFGTWVQMKDAFLLGAGDTYKAGDTGGTASHSHGLSSGYAMVLFQTGGATVRFKRNTNDFTADYVATMGSKATSESYAMNYSTSLGGTTDAANNLPPYVVVYMWKRTA